MKDLDTGKDKIQKICDMLRKETLEPAKQEAREVIENAHLQAAEIVAEANKKAAALMTTLEKEMEEKKRVFHASLNLACRQGIEQLRQTIEKQLFNPQLGALVGKASSDPQLIAELIRNLATAGMTALTPKSISPRAINELLSADVLKKLEGGTVIAGELDGGVKLQVKAEKITIDVSDSALKELIAQYIRKDLRDLIFNA